jgi:hypothetical protein
MAGYFNFFQFVVGVIKIFVNFSNNWRRLIFGKVKILDEFLFELLQLLIHKVVILIIVPKMKCLDFLLLFGIIKQYRAIAVQRLIRFGRGLICVQATPHRFFILGSLLREGFSFHRNMAGKLSCTAHTDVRGHLAVQVHVLLQGCQHQARV